MYIGICCVIFVIFSGFFNIYYCDVIHNNGIQGARCKTKCLAKYYNVLQLLKENNRRRRLKATVENCLRVPNCLSCIKPCNADPNDVVSCSKLCSASEIECHVSCLFLAEAGIHKSGNCPVSPSVKVLDATACASECSFDKQCPDNDKCCSSGCRYICRSPVYSNLDGLFPIPQDIKIEERRNGRAVRLQWSVPMGTRNVPAREPVLYVVEMRITLTVIRRKPSWDKMSPWTVVKQTHNHGAIISRIKPGHYYQFRIASVNEHGTKGFSPPSPVFISSREPFFSTYIPPPLLYADWNVSRPTRPRNVSEGVTILKNNNVDVNIHWKPPKRSDAPIWKYTVYWSERLRKISPLLIRIDVLEQSVPSDQNKLTLRRLNFGSTYFIQVEAVARLRNKILTSRRTPLYIHTYSPPGHTDVSPFDAVVSYHPGLIRVRNLSTQGQVYFQNGDLRIFIKWKVHPGDETLVNRYMVYWSPENCDQDYESRDMLANSATSHDPYFELYGLNYECSYIVKVMASNLAGKNGNPATLRFQTPMCSKVPVTENDTPQCPQRSIRPPKKPPDISYAMRIKKCNMIVEVAWKKAESDLPVSRYSVTWYRGHQNFLNHTKADNNADVITKTKVVPSSTNSLKLPDLEENQFYIIQVKAISKAGDGRTASIHLWTTQLPYNCSKDNKALTNVISTGNDVTLKETDKTETFNETGYLNKPNILFNKKSVAENSGNTQTCNTIVHSSLIYFIFNILQRLVH